MMRRLASLVKSPIARWVAAITVVVWILLIWRPNFTEFIELKFYDLKFQYRGARPAGPEVAIVSVDDESLKKVGRWPWSREDVARMFSSLKEAGPRVIALDIIFAEKQETSAFRTLENLCQEVTRRGAAPPEILRMLEEEKRKVDVDRRLAQVIGQDPPTVLGFFFRDVGGTSGAIKPERLLGPSVVKASTYNVVRLLETEPSHLPLLGASSVEVNLPEITEAAAGGGYFNMIPDPDGAVRWFPLAILFGPDIFAPMVMVGLDHYLGQPPMAITLSRLGVEEIRLGSRLVPVDRFGRMLINYLGPAGIIPTYSAAAVMEGRLPRQALKDKIVLVGATAVGIYDLRVTPFSGVFPGVEVQATVIENLLHGNFIKSPKFGLPLGLLLILGLGVLMGLMLPRFSAAWAFIFTLGLLEIYIIINYLLFSRLGYQMDLFYPQMEIILVYLGVTVQRFLAEERERERIKKTFESYVAPAVVQEMLKHPERLRLGGERRELTVLFADIRGFTTMSENLDPEALVSLLHDFLNPMSEIIIKNDGTIDKYMGDAIMALFGAPLEFPDHSRLACRAALDMIATLDSLNLEWEKQGRPPLKIGVGVNSGVVAVGNMGSDRLFDYTAIGDNVNLASRLEGLNKVYGTNILISQTTAEALGEGFILREVDRVRVKGKEQTSAIFELLGEGAPGPELASFVDLYRQGLTAYRERRWSESISALEAALEVRPQDAPTQRCLTAVKRLEKNPPGPDWEGVTVMDGK